jgi:hypothetical protein
VGEAKSLSAQHGKEDVGEALTLYRDMKDSNVEILSSRIEVKQEENWTNSEIKFEGGAASTASPLSFICIPGLPLTNKGGEWLPSLTVPLSSSSMLQ